MITSTEKTAVESALKYLSSLGQISASSERAISILLNEGNHRIAEIFLSINEVCKRSGYCRRTIDRYINSGILKSRKTDRGSIRVPASEVERVFGLRDGE